MFPNGEAKARMFGTFFKTGFGAFNVVIVVLRLFNTPVVVIFATEAV